MITQINAINYRSFRSISCPLQKFQVLAGPNGSSKSWMHEVICEKTHNPNINDWELMAQAKGNPENPNVIETLMLEYLKQGDQRLQLTLYPMDEYKKISEKTLNAIIDKDLNKLKKEENER